MNWLSWINMKVMGGVLAASLLANIFLFWGYTHQVEKKAVCTQAVEVVNKAATEKKIIIEKRQDNVTNETETRLRAELDRIRRSVLDRQSRQPDLPGTPSAPASADGTSTGAVLLPEDELVCDINTIKAAGWQDWYSNQVKIREEENAANAKNDRVPSP